MGFGRNIIHKNKKYKVLEDLPFKQKFKIYIHTYIHISTIHTVSQTYF